MRHRGLLLVSFYREIFRQQFVKYTPCCCYHSVFFVFTYSLRMYLLISFSASKSSKSRHYIYLTAILILNNFNGLQKKPSLNLYSLDIKWRNTFSMANTTTNYCCSPDMTLLEWFFFPFLQKSLFCHYCTPFVMHFQFPNVHLENGVVQFFEKKIWK